MKTRTRNPWLLFVLLATGVVIGGVLGEIFRDSIKILSYGKSIGFQPFTLDLSVIKLTLGFILHLNLASVIGIILAILIFSRL
ncbi:DUF4321 domain-containing protein [Thermotalea metallivorans]|uniref:DUF4321 domain-containing protein n=1 Tax=Thermotalea metallivorans TaxID=520762 RepID=A0A140L943_9FIRM|nr:DUF4321 domain-containing protein [Thermotalea metallivorans]KXG77068.1 hypothetical protein AN619_05960 [Thermotalea metallivorans]